MKIEAIQLNNVEELYEAIYAAQTSEKMKKEVGPHLNHLYQRISVVFQLSEVTPIDAMMLHKLTNGMTVDISGYQQAPIEITTPLSTAVSGLNRLMDRIVSDIDVSAVMEIDTPSFMPLSYFRKTVLVTLTDTAIGMVFGADPTFVFYNAYKEDGFPYPFKESDKLLDILCKNFFENYYKALLAEINTNDMIADGMSYNSYYRPTMESDYLLSHAITPFGTIGIMRCENDTLITKENSERLIQMARAANKVASDDWIFLQTKLIYVMRIPIFIYCMLEEKLPPGSIIDHEYFRIVATDEIILDEDDIAIPKYEVRLKEKFEDYVKEFNRTGPQDILGKMIHLPADTLVSCIVSLSLEDISNDVVRLIKWITDNVREDSFAQRWLEELLCYIRDTSKIVFQQFSF